MVKILSDWFVGNENYKGKTIKWDIENLKEIGVKFEVIQDKRKEVIQ